MPGYRNIPQNSDCYSEIAHPGGRVFCITVPEADICGISKNTIKYGLQMQRKGLVYCWPYHKEGRSIYLHFDGLKKEYKALIKSILMDGLTPDEWYAGHGRLNDTLTLFKQFLSMTKQDEQYFDEAMLPTGESIPEAELTKAREACKWLYFLSKCDRKKDILSLGYATVAAFYDDVTFAITNKGVRLPKAYTKLKEKIRDYKEKGACVCVDLRKQTNKNASKVYTKEQVSMLSRILSDGASWNCRQVVDTYNAIAKAKGWDTIGRRSVWDYKREYHLYINAGRNGVEAFRNKISMQVRRSKPTEAFSFWSLDGWDVELYYQKTGLDKNSHKITTYDNRLTAVIVVDASCNYPIGYAIGDRENTDLIKSAVKNAIDHSKALLGEYYRPYQIQSDHFGIKTLTPFYDGIAKAFVPARVKNAKAKPVERSNKYFNDNYCQIYFKDNWSGVGIKSSAEHQPNIDILNANKRNFPDREGCVRQIERMFELDRELKHDIFMEKFNKMPEAERLILSRENYLYKFGNRNERTKRLEAGSFNPTILGVIRDYDSFDLNFRKQPLTSWTVVYDEQDLSTILVMDNTEKKRFILTEKYIQPMDLRGRKPGDYDELRKIDEFNKNVLEKHVSDEICNRWESASQTLKGTPELEGKKAYTMLTDSKGQHKSYLKPAALMPSEEDLAITLVSVEKKAIEKATARREKKEKKQALRAHEAAYEAYIDSEIDYSKYK